jgi:hypothetical protein
MLADSRHRMALTEILIPLQRNGLRQGRQDEIFTNVKMHLCMCRK